MTVNKLMEKSSEIDNKTHYNDNIFECEAESELCMALRKTINSRESFRTMRASSI